MKPLAPNHSGTPHPAVHGREPTHSVAALWLLLIVGTAAGCVRAGGEHLGQSVVEGKAVTAASFPAGATTAPDALIARGAEVYLQQYCGICHRLDRAGTAGTFGPSHNGYAAIAANRIQSDDYTGRATTAAEYTCESIVDPNAYVVPGYAGGMHAMPSYEYLSTQELDALVHLLLSAE